MNKMKKKISKQFKGEDSTSNYNADWVNEK